MGEEGQGIPHQQQSAADVCGKKHVGKKVAAEHHDCAVLPFGGSGGAFDRAEDNILKKRVIAATGSSIS